MDSTEILDIERECEHLVKLYCHYVDHGQAERVGELFAKDGVWRGSQQEYHGLDEIQQALKTRQANQERMSRHICTNVLIEAVDSDHATGTAYLIVYRHDGKIGREVSPLPGPDVVGEYRDKFVRTSDGWKIQERVTKLNFVRGAFEQD
jgi:hypothetical protein